MRDAARKLADRIQLLVVKDGFLSAPEIANGADRVASPTAPSLV